MKPIIKLFVVFCFLSSLLNCQSQNCNINLDNKNYQEAIQEIKQANFDLEQKINVSSTWIKRIEYYSCDNEIGFLIMTTFKNKQYLHNYVSIDLWNKFKEADSFGRFYNSNLKGRYQY